MAFLLAVRETESTCVLIGADEQTSRVLGAGEQRLDFSWSGKVRGAIGILAHAWLDEVFEHVKEHCQDKEDTYGNENPSAIEPELCEYGNKDDWQYESNTEHEK